MATTTIDGTLVGMQSKVIKEKLEDGTTAEMSVVRVVFDVRQDDAGAEDLQSLLWLAGQSFSWQLTPMQPPLPFATEKGTVHSGNKIAQALNDLGFEGEATLTMPKPKAGSRRDEIGDRIAGELRERGIAVEKNAKIYLSDDRSGT
jgi:hypothetical protein